MIEVNGFPFLSGRKEGTGGNFFPAMDFAILGTMPFILSSMLTSHPATIAQQGARRLKCSAARAAMMVDGLNSTVAYRVKDDSRTQLSGSERPWLSL